MENERSYTISIGFYFGILLGTRVYEEEDYNTYVFYLPFIDLAITVDK
jgi:hypothetical protein